MNRKTAKVLAIFNLIAAIAVIAQSYGWYCTDGGLCAIVQIDKSNLVTGLIALGISISVIVYASEIKEK